MLCSDFHHCGLISSWVFLQHLKIMIPQSLKNKFSLLCLAWLHGQRTCIPSDEEIWLWIRRGYKSGLPSQKSLEMYSVFILCIHPKMPGTWLFHDCSLPLYFVVYGQPWEVHTMLPCCPEHSDYTICLTSLWVPLHLGTSHCKACFGSVLDLFSTALWNLVSLRGLIRQGARKEHGTD